VRVRKREKKERKFVEKERKKRKKCEKYEKELKEHKMSSKLLVVEARVQKVELDPKCCMNLPLEFKH
jgi:division protein CdvB (Snf7/Vps24/ESCRT-III family)